MKEDKKANIIFNFPAKIKVNQRSKKHSLWWKTKNKKKNNKISDKNKQLVKSIYILILILLLGIYKLKTMTIQNGYNTFTPTTKTYVLFHIILYSITQTTMDIPNFACMLNSHFIVYLCFSFIFIFFFAPLFWIEYGILLKFE